jgi:membrane protein DedA with SNARE-associated domain
MIEVLDQFVTWMGALPPLGIYLVLFGISVGENLVPPVPGDVAIVVAGSLVGLGTVSLIPTFSIAVLGSVLGFLAMYGIGRQLGEAIHDPNRLRWIPSGPLDMVARWLDRWGYGVVAANRFLSGGRSVIALLVGASELRLVPTALWATLSALLWTSVLIGGGYVVGSEWERAIPWMRAYGKTVTFTLALIGLAMGARWWLRRRRQETAKTPDGSDGGGARG